MLSSVPTPGPEPGTELTPSSLAIADLADTEARISFGEGILLLLERGPVLV